jgi:NAD(P)-dependent dehydrogenase (short-subunit alcohol dehydrogenase family)
MPRECEGRVAIVTGGSRGIGRAVALRLAAEGAAVAVTGRSLAPGSHAFAGSLEETAAAIQTAGGRAIAIGFDLSEPGRDRAEIVARAEAAFGRPADILVNNAAAPRQFQQRFQDVPRETFVEAIEVNVWAAWELSQLVIPGMRAHGAGWIVNISSRGAGPKLGPPYTGGGVGSQAVYGGSKALLDRMTTAAAMDLYDDNIAVNALAPEAAVATENALSVADLPPGICEPEETMAEATLALCVGDPKVLTGRIAYSLSLLVELGRPVRTLDGASLVPAWQPEEIDERRLFPGYLVDMP